MSSEPQRPPEAAAARPIRWRYILGLLAAVIIVDLIAYYVFPPYDPEVGGVCAYPVCFINGNLELPAPHVIIGTPPPAGELVSFTVSITSTIVTMWIVAIVVLVLLTVLAWRPRLLPDRRQNAVEWAYEALESFAISLGGPQAKPYIPLFAGFFLFILFSNWSGLIPPIGKVEELRAPTSDVNVTIGLALVAFFFFEYQGFRKLGVRGYLSKFFPLGAFREGIGNGIISLFVGLIELLLEFVKPVTLSMRLFGNIYGGEVALGVITALTVAILPVGLFALEVILNFIQALIFSTLTLIFTLVAIEDPHEEPHEPEREPHATPVSPGLVGRAASDAAG